jgi:CDGSH-type Zn-finger protein
LSPNAEGDSLEYQEGKKFPAQPQYALCRCGQSASKPFCDGTHAMLRFDGTETTSHEPYLQPTASISPISFSAVPLTRHI